MATSDQQLLAGMAERDPAALASTLVVDRDNEQIVELLQVLPDQLAGQVLARFPQSRLRGILAADKAFLSRRLEAVGFDTALHLLARLPRDHALTLVHSLQDPRLQRRLLRFLRFPEHSVGGLTPTSAVQVLQDTPIEQVLMELGELAVRGETPIVLLDDNRRYLGKLDLWRLATIQPPSGKAADYLLPAPGLLPETSLVSARQLRVWDVHGWLPLVTHEKRVLGAMTRKQIFARSDRSLTDQVAQVGSVELLTRAMFRVSGRLLTRLLDVKSR